VTDKLEQFRLDLYETLPSRRDTLLDLLDALASNTTARSVVELSLSPFFRRDYSSLTDGTDNFFQATVQEQEVEERREWEQKLVRVIAPYLVQPQKRVYWLFGVDVTSLPRPYAATLADRTYVYQPNTLKGNKPVNIGHQSSVLAWLPEKEKGEPAWVVPLIVRRVTSQERKNEVGAEQLRDLLADQSLPFEGELKVIVADSDYSKLPFLGSVYCETKQNESDDLVTIVRAANNRTFCHAPPEIEGKQPVGHPTWYGTPFRLPDPETWSQADKEERTTWTTHRGKSYRVQLQSWHNIRMTGSREYPMHEHPFTLVRAVVFDEEGQPRYKHPLWLIVIGKRREEVSLIETWEAYGQRVDLEHYFRFGKQKLLLNSYQTPEVEHEENWGQIVQLAYILLWLAAKVVEDMPRPWEKSQPRKNGGLTSPGRAQRGFGGIISQIGTPAKPPKPRGNSPGRAKGEKPGLRQHQPVIKKGKKRQNLPVAA
jgi:hypothetical protein